LSSFEPPITEIDVNSYENASNIQIIDEEICSSSDQSEINAFSPEIGSRNVINISLEKNTTNSWKREKSQLDIGRGFQIDWVSKFPFIEPIPPKNEKEKPKVRCNICSWKLVKSTTFLMKLDTT
jgi:hypothetical protein